MLEDHVTNTLYAFTAVVNTAVFQGCKSNVLPITAYKIKASQYMSFANTIKKKKKIDIILFLSKPETGETEIVKAKQKSKPYAQAVSRASICPQPFPDFVRQSVIRVVKALSKNGISCATSGLFSVYKDTHKGTEAGELARIHPSVMLQLQTILKKRPHATVQNKIKIASILYQPFGLVVSPLLKNVDKH